MTSFASRRWRSVLLTTGLAVLTVAGYGLLKISLRPTAIITGLALLALVLLLTLFNARKKLPFLPLLKASTWTQVHIYAGWFTGLLFLLHVQFRVPQGTLETWLAIAFLAVILSGLFGLLISRALPPRLSRREEQYIFERIPALRRELQKEVEDLVRRSVAEADSSAIPDFYLTELKAFFDRPRHFWLHCQGSDKPLHARLRRIETLDRYLNPQEKEILSAIAGAVRVKDNLDFQRASQGLLKGWLFVHIPLTYALILLASTHGWLAWYYRR